MTDLKFPNSKLTLMDFSDFVCIALVTTAIIVVMFACNLKLKSDIRKQGERIERIEKYIQDTQPGLYQAWRSEHGE